MRSFRTLIAGTLLTAALLGMSGCLAAAAGAGYVAGTSVANENEEDWD